MTNVTFAELVKEEFPIIGQYTPVLVRVHGEAHPELASVLEVFKKINKAANEKNLDELELRANFQKLREITQDYSLPSDACETYIETYNMLARADKTYHLENN
ncbi:MAG: iron-sulfur cluster repair di-iron protein, ric [Syntrophomonadaceae bacterium]|nr:iron-sulfur cluster repair di-iron protein, ric [Syntrophomonadaceae bacterium]